MNVGSRADSAFSSLVTMSNSGILSCDPAMVNYGLHASWITPNALYGIHQVGPQVSSAAGILPPSACLEIDRSAHRQNHPDPSQIPSSSSQAAATGNAAASAGSDNKPAAGGAIKTKNRRGRQAKNAPLGADADDPVLRPFPCTYCGKRFKQKTHLVQHERIHTDERPYICTFCNRAFKQLSQQIQHERVHTDNRPYVCPVCTEKFRQKNHLDSHMKSHFL